MTSDNPIFQLCKSIREQTLFLNNADEKNILDEAFGHVTRLKYKKGEMIFRAGGYPKGVFMLYKGKIKIFRVGMDGKEVITFLAGAGDLIGYLPALSDGLYKNFASALEDSELYLINKEYFLQLIHKIPSIYSYVTKLVSRDIRIAEKRELALSHKSVRQRVAESLLMVKKIYGQEDGNDSALNVNLSRQDWANFVGTVKETLIRQLINLKNEKIIELDGKRIKILNEKKLLEAIYPLPLSTN